MDKVYYIFDEEQSVRVYRDLDWELWNGMVQQMLMFWPNWQPSPALLGFYHEKLRQYPAIAVWRFIEEWAQSGEDFPPIVGKILAYLEPRHGERIQNEKQAGLRGADGKYLPVGQLMPLILEDRRQRRQPYTADDL